MLMASLALLAAQGGASPARQTVVRDSGSTTTRVGAHTPVRRAVTAELLASAYHDTVSRNLIARARVTRLRQDSTLASYDAKVVQRLTVKAALAKVPLEKLAYRQESAARIRWQRDVGARVDFTGARVAIPAIGMPNVERDNVTDQLTDPDMTPIPYFPGREPLWVGTLGASAEVNESDIVNPLAGGAEAYYTYRATDAVTLQLGGGSHLTVQQVDVRPRLARSNTVIGSLWFDRATGQLVRAAYRLALPSVAQFGVVDSAGKPHRTAARIIAALTPRMTGEISSVVVEYELFDGYWFPRVQSLAGVFTTSLARVPVTLETRFSYASVNSLPPLAPIELRDTTRKAIDSVKAAARHCGAGSTRVITRKQSGSGVPVELRSPCDVETLASSPDLPPSIYDPGDEFFSAADAAQLVSEALSMNDQPPFSLTDLPPMTWRYGLSMSRYNRIEGFSTGVEANQQLGAGMDITASARLSTAGHEHPAEISLGRSNALRSVRIGAYQRLVSVSDWDSPLTFGSSLSALFLGRDDAFYYRTLGGELTWTSDQFPRLQLRGFVEQQSAEVPHTDFSIGGSFLPNIAATPGRYVGGSLRWLGSRGLDPRGFRFSSDLRLEAATADSSYGRAALDLTAQHSLGGLDASLTAAGGTSVGAVPTQRLWYLGGTQTVRGERPDPFRGGNAFWLGRAELGHTMSWFRPTVFGDLGWAGDRTKLSETGRPTSGYGVGASFLDGAVRLDLARGVFPARKTIFSFYLGARF